MKNILNIFAESDHQQARLREDVLVALQGAAVLLRDAHPARLQVIDVKKDHDLRSFYK